MKLKPWHWLVLAICIAVFVVVFYRDHQVTEGQKTYSRLGCPNCHTSGGGPSLAKVGRKYDRLTLVEWLSNPAAVYARLGRKLNPGCPAMSRQRVSRHDIEMISYFLAAQR